jgi:hypothetical protein
VSDWMWFVIILFALLLIFTCVSKWIDAKITIETIMREELENDDDRDDSEDR